MARDILEFWNPRIDWSNFRQGPVSDTVWEHFKWVMVWCHVFRHWDADVEERRRSPPRRTIFPEESDRDFRKRKEQWQRDNARCERYKYRALYHANTKIAEMSHLDAVAKWTPDAPDQKLWSALRTVMLNGKPAACAFESFDAEQELKDGAEAVASRWLKQEWPAVVGRS
jgi:hypothetical protein